MAKTQAEIDDDTRYRNKFRDGPNDPDSKSKVKRVFNKATGKFQDAAPRLDAKKWYGKKIAGHSQNKKAQTRTAENIKKAEE